MDVPAQGQFCSEAQQELTRAALGWETSQAVLSPLEGGPSEDSSGEEFAETRLDRGHCPWHFALSKGPASTPAWQSSLLPGCTAPRHSPFVRFLQIKGEAAAGCTGHWLPSAGRSPSRTRTQQGGCTCRSTRTWPVPQTLQGPAPLCQAQVWAGRIQVWAEGSVWGSLGSGWSQEKVAGVQQRV